MNSQSSQPGMMEDPDRPPPQGAFPVWSRVFTKPGEGTFVEITEHPDASAKNAYIWVFIAGTFSGLINSLVQFVVGLAGLRQTMPEFDQLPGFTVGLGVGGLVSAICTAPLTGLFSVIGFAIGVALIHWVARFLGGQGTFDKLSYAMTAITAPVTLISAFLIPVNAIPYASFCTLPAFFLLGLYVIYLNITAAKSVHRFGWLEAIIAVFLPAIMMGFLCAFLFLGAMRMLGPSINDILRQMQQGL